MEGGDPFGPYKSYMSDPFAGPNKPIDRGRLLFEMPENKEMTKQQIIENYFKALGWEWKKTRTNASFPITDGSGEGNFIGDEWCWCLNGNKVGESRKVNPDVTPRKSDLPNITESFSAFKKWVIEEMDRRGWKLTNSGRFVQWMPKKSQPVGGLYEEIKDNEILSAAVIAATEYLGSENAKFKIKSK